MLISMSTVQCSKPAQNEEQKQWSSVFPSCDISTEQQSILFVKKLVAVGISSITYLRVIFPEEAYQDHFAEGLNLKLLMNESGCSGASTLISWINGCFDALEKKYLKQMTLSLCVDPKNPNNSTETYTFKFSYAKSGAVNLDTVETNQHDGEGKENKYEVKKPTLKMLRTIIMLTETLRPFPNDVLISMKLLYYDEVTPPDYEPPCFQPSKLDSDKCSEETVTYKIGEVSTPFHTVRLKAKISNYMHEGEDPREETTYNHVTNLPQVGEAAIQKSVTGNLVNVVPTTPTLSEVQCSGVATPAITPRLADILSSCEGSLCSMRSLDLSLAVTQGPSQSEYPVRCPCKVNKDHGIMILCDVCGFWQHGACFTIIDESHGPAKHFCNICADPPSLCTDPRLSNVSDEEKVRITCIFRRALVVLKTFEGKMTPAKMAHLLGVDISIGVSVVDKMLSDGILRHGSSKRFTEVDKKTLLKSAFPKYLNKVVWQSPEKTNSSIKEITGAFQSKNASLTGSESFIDVEAVNSFCESPLKRSSQRSERSSSVIQNLAVQASSTDLAYRSLNGSKEISVINDDSQLTKVEDVIFTKLASRKFGRQNNLKEAARLDGEISDSLGSTQQTPKKRKLSSTYNS